MVLRWVTCLELRSAAADEFCAISGRRPESETRRHAAKAIGEQTLIVDAARPEIIGSAALSVDPVQDVVDDRPAWLARCRLPAQHPVVIQSLDRAVLSLQI